WVLQPGNLVTLVMLEDPGVNKFKELEDLIPAWKDLVQALTVLQNGIEVGLITGENGQHRV
ncbi:11289_t:CDS:2, partial [Gigaspora rosea]